MINVTYRPDITMRLIPLKLRLRHEGLVRPLGSKPPAQQRHGQSNFFTSVPSPRGNGAGEENRTLATSLEGWSSTIELHPHLSAASRKDRLNTLVEGLDSNQRRRTPTVYSPVGLATQAPPQNLPLSWGDPGSGGPQTARQHYGYSPGLSMRKVNAQTALRPLNLPLRGISAGTKRPLAVQI